MAELNRMADDDKRNDIESLYHSLLRGAGLTFLGGILIALVLAAVLSRGTGGIAIMSPGTLMPGPGSGGCALFGTDGSRPNVRPGSGAGAQGGPAEDGADLADVLAGFGAGAMAGRNGSAGGGCISPRLLPPCQPPAAAQPLVLAGPAGGTS